MADPRILQATLLSLLLFSLHYSPILSSATAVDDDEDLSFLEEPESGDALPSHHHHSEAEYTDNEDEDFDSYDDFEVPSDFNHQDHEDEDDEVAQFDEKDVVVLTDGNFSDFVGGNKHVMVEFYAPWCGHCQSLAPEYAAAATALNDTDVKLAKVDATVANELAETYEIQGFPTLFFFVDGDHKPYPGQRTK